MRLNVVLRYVGIILLVIALFMLLSAGVSYANNIDSGFYPLLLSSLLTALLGAFPLIFVDRVEQFSSKEGYCIVVSSWILACFVGMFPYLIWGGEFTPINAWFESVSGYTTTGASILVDIEALPRGILFWRACSTSTHTWASTQPLASPQAPGRALRQTRPPPGQYRCLWRRPGAQRGMPAAQAPALAQLLWAVCWRAPGRS